MGSVFLYVPNLIGYARVVLALAGFAVAARNHILFMYLYCASFLLDAADGYAARLLDQKSQLGAVLDMVTDRCGTAGLVVVLIQSYPDFAPIGIALIFLDIFSHWFDMYASRMRGSQSHKERKQGENILLRLYYEERWMLATVCLVNEFFYVFFYLWQFYPQARIGVYLCAPVFLFKQSLSVVQLRNACVNIVEIESQQANPTSPSHTNTNANASTSKSRPASKKSL